MSKGKGVGVTVVGFWVVVEGDFVLSELSKSLCEWLYVWENILGKVGVVSGIKFDFNRLAGVTGGSNGLWGGGLDKGYVTLVVKILGERKRYGRGIVVTLGFTWMPPTIGSERCNYNLHLAKNFIYQNNKRANKDNYEWYWSIY